jgi:HEAT repeat protein
MTTPENPAEFDDPEDEFASRFDEEVEDDYDELEDEYDDDLDDEFDEDDDDLDDEDDEFDDDEDDLDLRDELAENLAAFFAGDDFEIVDLKALLAESGDDADVALLGAYAASTLADTLRRLREHDRLPDLSDLATLGNVAPADLDILRTQWPAVPVAVRRAALDRLIAAVEEEDLPLDLSDLLRLALDDADATVRRLAVDALAQEGDPAFLGRLTQMARHDADTAVRAGAAAALGAYVLAGELDELEPALAMRAEEALMMALADGNEALDVQRRALESIAYSGEVGVRQLIEDAYYSAHEDMRLSALTAMGRSADSRWRNLVRAELSNPSAAIRAEAAFAVGELEAKAALAEIVALTGDEDATVRLAAIYALGHLGGAEARTVLRRISNSSDTVEAAAADDALEEMAFYASDEAEAFPLYDEDEDDDEDEDWRFSSNPDLGVYN